MTKYISISMQKQYTRGNMLSKSIGFSKRHFCGNPVFSVLPCMLQKAGLETEATKALIQVTRAFLEA